MQRFIIGGLPRSGTAWIANYISLHEGVFCWHEAIQYGDRFTSYSEAIDQPRAWGNRMVGDATTAILPAYDEVEARRVFIVRNPDECAKSYLNCMGDEALKGWSDVLANALNWLETHHPERIPFSDIFSPEIKTARRACAWLLETVAGVNFNEDIFRLAYEKEVQIFGLNDVFYNNKTIITQP